MLKNLILQIIESYKRKEAIPNIPEGIDIPNIQSELLKNDEVVPNLHNPSLLEIENCLIELEQEGAIKRIGLRKDHFTI